MLLLTLGLMLVIGASLSISFPQLCHALKSDDVQTWKRLGSPNGHSMADFGKSAGLFSWVLNHEFENSKSEQVITVGMQAYRKAQAAKYAMLAGVIMIIVGFGAALFGL